MSEDELDQAIERYYRLRDREFTYTSHYKARRAFYKWVAKNQLYYPLRWCLQWRHDGREHWAWERIPVRGHTTYVYSNGFGHLGMPVFRNWKSEAWDAWNREFLKHREAWIDDVAKRQRAQWGARGREVLHAGNAPKVFQVLAAASILKK